MPIICCDCEQELAKANFTKSQLRKDPSARRCRNCVHKREENLGVEEVDEISISIQQLQQQQNENEQERVPTGEVEVENVNVEDEVMTSISVAEEEHPAPTPSAIETLGVENRDDNVTATPAETLVEMKVEKIDDDDNHNNGDVDSENEYNKHVAKMDEEENKNENSNLHDKEKQDSNDHVESTSDSNDNDTGNNDSNSHDLVEDLDERNVTTNEDSNATLTKTDSGTESIVIRKRAKQEVDETKEEKVESIEEEKVESIEEEIQSVSALAKEEVEPSASKEKLESVEEEKEIDNNEKGVIILTPPCSSPSNDIGEGIAETENENEPIEEEEEEEESECLRLGICAMDKKARSKPMGEILSRLDKTIFEIVYFGDELILNAPVEDWPLCDVLIAFYSAGYPLEKAEEYSKLHEPFILNDLQMQRVLMDRRRVYDLLEASGIDVPRHVYMNRDGYVSTPILPAKTSHSNSDTMSVCSKRSDDSDHDAESELVEYDDHIEVNGVRIDKPFVEKPVDADDHNIAIYYPNSAGGGCKKLFRKIGDRSSEFYPHINEVRRDGSFIYEEFVETQGTDVKMYTVGPDYGHAEARKSPAVDGKVERNADGKEVRFPVILTLREKEIARRIVMVFKQQVCGFDLLRVQEGDSLMSFVCDVNGWSFVKKSKKYYEDCAQLLTEICLAAKKPELHHGFSALDPLLTKVRDSVLDTPRARRSRSRTLNLRSNSQNIYSSPERSDDQSSTVSYENSAVTLAEGAVHIRLISGDLMPATHSMASDDDSVNSKASAKSQATATHQEELRCVIAVIRHGDRTPKQKLKVKMSEPLLLKFFHDNAENYKKELKVKDKIPMTNFLETVREIIAINKKKTEEVVKDGSSAKKNEFLLKMLHMRDILERWKIGGLNRKLQMKPTKWDEYIDGDGKKILRCAQLQLILKWGGNLTKLGEKQAINLGKRLRLEVYPDIAGGGILRLHSTFRHDLKIKTSDEGRVMKTAAAFAKGLLELEGEIPPILVSLVHKEKNSNQMLDPSGNKEVKKELEACKVEVNKNLQQDFDFDKADPKTIETIIGPPVLKSLHTALSKVQNPRNTLFAIHQTIGELLEQLDEMLGGITSDMENKYEGGEGLIGDEDVDETLSGIKLYKGETLLELTERWRLLYIKLYDEEDDEFDLSRVPDVHDNVRFDMLHNPHLGLTDTLKKLYELAKLMADCVVPQEYGTTIEQKRGIGNKMCSVLLDKLLYDLVIARTDNQVDMRYMINLQYSADIPINTMGRRIRTRLYFTSESHLHTLLNVLRFDCANGSSAVKSLLTQRGINIISSAPELCYLTQIVIRLFENTSKEEKDPKRFRIEIFFSPGATATPLHKSERKRDTEDKSRFDTEPMQLISRPHLTCEEVEEYFKEAIKAGKTEEDDADTFTEPKVKEQIEEKESQMIVEVKDNNIERAKTVTISEDNNTSTQIPTIVEVADEDCDQPSESNLDEDVPDDNNEGKTDNDKDHNITIEVEASSATIPEDIDEDEIDKVQEMAKVLARQYFWTSVAAFSFVLGIGCIILSREIVTSDFKTRRWTRR